MDISEVGIFILQKVQHELLAVYANQLLEKEHSGCHALLRDDKVNTLLFPSFWCSKFSAIYNDDHIAYFISLIA